MNICFLSSTLWQLLAKILIFVVAASFYWFLTLSWHVDRLNLTLVKTSLNINMIIRSGTIHGRRTQCLLDLMALYT